MKRYSAPSPLYPTSVVAKMLNMSDRTIRNRAKQDNTFPQPLRSSNGKTLGWVPGAFEKWMQQH
ncbi:MAG: putative DNA-binding transcriptional regulator AlpA [Oleiphilaceae bacterium]|jgi:predicted DNA-binding transcriptional regulator AlpA